MRADERLDILAQLLDEMPRSIWVPVRHHGLTEEGLRSMQRRLPNANVASLLYNLYFTVGVKL